MCHEKGCSKDSVYNFKDIRKPIFCILHKKDGMTNVKFKICENSLCENRARYNFENEKTPILCLDHKEDGMFNITSIRCIHEKCKITAGYNYANFKKPLYCSEHKKDNMIDLKSKKCLHKGCKVIPSFNFENEKVPIYCVEHSKDNMVNVKNKLCKHQKCKKHARFNYENEKELLYCNDHKLDNMINISAKRCKTHLCSVQTSNTDDEGYCLRCFINLFPDKPTTRNYKTKEQSVVEFILSEFGQYDWITDKRIKDGCSKRRPDLLLDMGDQVIIVEIDENQHIDYDCSCENKRTMELSQDINHRPMIFIRFNPDNYNENGKSISSCWSINKSGICVISKTKTREWSDRLSALKSQIEYWCSNRTDKTVEIVQLFYDI